MRVAIIIPTMNRPEFLLRQLEFYELMDSPHPVYISDSSNLENAEKIKNEIKKFKSFEIIYQWAPPGKDCLHQLLPLVKEKYCIQMGDDDIMIPKTMSECADFLEEHPDYATCSGHQMNIRFRQEDYNEPYGIIAKRALLLGTSMDNDDMLSRAKNFLANTDGRPFISFMVTRTEVEKSIRDISKNFSLMEHMTEFLIVSILITSGKLKVLDKLGYIMQVSGKRHDFSQDILTDFITSAEASGRWRIGIDGLTEIFQKTGISPDESLRSIRLVIILYLVHKFSMEAEGVSLNSKTGASEKKYLSGKIFRKVKRLLTMTGSGSKYFNDFKIVKDFLEKDSIKTDL